MNGLNEKDKELINTGEVVDLTSINFRYLGGSFLKNENDYIEFLIYDTNDNFLESSIVDESDYIIESHEPPEIKLKTGTILRKMGYDRGKFVVKYRFLRGVAGSPIPLSTQLPASSTVVSKENKYDYKYLF